MSLNHIDIMGRLTKAPEANKVAIKALLTQGADIPCARLTQNTSITIK